MHSTRQDGRRLLRDEWSTCSPVPSCPWGVDALEHIDVGHGVVPADNMWPHGMAGHARDSLADRATVAIESGVGQSEGKRGGCALRAEFWSGLAGYLDDSRGAALTRANVDDYFKLRTPVNGCSLYLIARTRLGEIGVRFALQGIEHAALFSHLQSRRARLDRLTKGRLCWQRASERASVLEVRRSAQLEDRDSWPEYYLWLGQQIETLEAVFMPLLGRRPGGSASRSSWNRQRFLDDIARWNPWSVNAAEKVLNWAPSVLPVHKWGSGAKTGTLLCGVRRELDTCMPMALKSSGVIVFRLADMAHNPPWDQRIARVSYLDRLRRIPHVDLPDSACDQRPFVPFDVIADENAWPEFTSAMEWLVAVTTGRSCRRRARIQSPS